MRNEPLSEFDDPSTRSLFNVKPMSSKSLRTYILSLTTLVEDRFRNICLTGFKLCSTDVQIRRRTMPLFA